MESWSLDVNDVTWMASTFKGQETFFEEIDTTFAPPNSPMPNHSRSSYIDVLKPRNDVPRIRNVLSSDFDDESSPVVRGMLDNTWYADSVSNSALNTKSNDVSSFETYPYFPLSHDLTFRASGNGSNQFLNESNIEFLQNSLTDSNKKRKRANLMSPEKVENENSPWMAFTTPSRCAPDFGKSCKILDPIIQMFLKTEAGDSNVPYILTCLKELLSSTIITPNDLCNEAFLSKSAEMMRIEHNEDTLFHLLTLFERYLCGTDHSLETHRLLSNKVRQPLGRIAGSGHEELASRAEKCLLLLGDEN